MSKAGIRKVEDRLLTIFRVVAGGVFVWFGLLYVLEKAGFTNVETLPLFSGDAAFAVGIVQIIVGAVLLFQKAYEVGEFALVLYVVALGYNIATNFSLLFDPSFPALSALGYQVLLELTLIAAGFALLVVTRRTLL